MNNIPITKQEFVAAKLRGDIDNIIRQAERKGRHGRVKWLEDNIHALVKWQLIAFEPDEVCGVFVSIIQRYYIYLNICEFNDHVKCYIPNHSDALFKN